MLPRIVSLVCVIVQALQGVLTVTLAADILDIHTMQQWVLLAAFIPYISLFDFGITQTIIRELSMTIYGDSRKEHMTREASIVRSLVVASSSCVMMFSFFIFIYVVFNDRDKYYLFIFISAASIRVISNMLLAVVFVKKSVLFEKSIRLMGAIAYLLGVAICLDNGFGLYSLGIAIFVQGVFFILLSLIGGKDFFRLVSKVDFSFKIVKELYPNLRDWTLSSIPSLFVFNFTIYTISTVLDAEKIVEYSILYQLFFGVLTVCGIPISLSSPRWSQIYIQKNMTELVFHIKNVLNEVAVLSFSGCFFLIFYGDIIIPFIKNNITEVNSIAIIIFSLLIFIESIQTTLTYACFSCKNTNYTKITVVAGISSVVFSFIGAKYLDLTGAVAGVFLSQLFTCSIFNIRRAINFFGYPLIHIIKVISSGSILILLCAFLASLLSDYFHTCIINYIVVSILMFSVSIFVLLFIVDDRGQFFSKLNRLVKKGRQDD